MMTQFVTASPAGLGAAETTSDIVGGLVLFAIATAPFAVAAGVGRGTKSIAWGAAAGIGSAMVLLPLFANRP